MVAVTRHVLFRRGLFPVGLAVAFGMVALVERGWMDAQVAIATLPVGFIVVLSTLELLAGRWGPHWRRLGRDVFLLAVSGALDATGRVLATSLALSLGDGGSGAVRSLPLVAALPLGLVVADLAAYGVHRAFHSHALLWRMHALHHAPRELYALMSSVNAPLMVLFVRAAPVIALVICGFSANVLVAYALVDAWIGLCSHTGIDTHNPWLSEVFVTPQVHRLHHSDRPEHAGNHALTFTLWDRVFGTYISPRDRAPVVTPGLAEPNDLPTSWVDLLLLRSRR